jgi:hypothetical protein
MMKKVDLRAKKRVRRMRVKHADGLKHGGKRY